MTTRACALLLTVLLAGCSSATLDGRGSVGSSRGVGSSGGTSGPGSAAPGGTAPAAGAAFDDPGQVRRILTDATRDVVAANSYDYRTLPRTLAAGLAASTGAFATKYRQTFTLVIERSAPAQHAISTAAVNGVGVGPVTATGATVLMFGQISVRNLATPAGRVDPFVTTVHLQPVGGRWLIAGLDTGGDIAGDPPGNVQLAMAAQAARTAVTDILTFTRAHFAADYARALATTSGSLRADLTGRRAQTLAALTTGGFDLATTVHGVAVVTASGDTAVLLVEADGFRVTNGGRGTPIPESLRITVTRTGGVWTASDLAPVGIR